jgi:hypothetical protein
MGVGSPVAVGEVEKRLKSKDERLKKKEKNLHLSYSVPLWQKREKQLPCYSGCVLIVCRKDVENKKKD